MSVLRERRPGGSPWRRWAGGVSRGVAGAMGLFALANAAVSLLHGWTPLDRNIWWIDSRPLPSWLANPIVLLSGALLLAFAVKPLMTAWRRRATRAALVLLFAASLWNTFSYWGLLALGTISSPVVVPLSFWVGAVLAWLWFSVGRGQRPEDESIGAMRWRRMLDRGMVVGGFLLVPALFPLAQMYSFGLTDYRRPADAAVVFGAAVWPGDRPSHALLDRVNTGIELYDEGLVDLLVMSGGPSSSPEIAHEVDVMRRLALEAGIPDEAVVLDYRGINSQATVDNCADIFVRHGIRKALAISHFYHLPRVKMTFERAGLDVYTVPARETHILYALPYYMAREVAAIWVYYVRPILGP